MITIQRRNVNGMYAQGTKILRGLSKREETRNGPVLVADTPVISIYERPQERVLFLRPTANPFFHIMESMWMLDGRDDAAFLDNYVQDFGSRFGEGPDDNRYIHGAYGHRWRRALGFDQLNAVIEKLRNNPQDRQCVIQMWDASDPHHVTNGQSGWSMGSGDLLGDWKDRPCNTHVYLRRRDDGFTDPVLGNAGVLDLTVCCRSNDIVWGAYGANAVHFSVLQEYLAGRIGCGIGTMYQFSNNWHGYLDTIAPSDVQHLDPYFSGEVSSVPLGTDWQAWDDDLGMFMGWHALLWGKGAMITNDLGILADTMTNRWFVDVAGRAALAWRFYKTERLADAVAVAGDIIAPDWRRACLEWLERRVK